MELKTVPDGWIVIIEMDQYQGVGQKPPYPDGELPEGEVRLQHQYRAKISTSLAWLDYSLTQSNYINSDYYETRIVAISTPPTEQEEMIDESDPVFGGLERVAYQLEQKGHPASASMIRLEISQIISKYTITPKQQ